jgi:hypothetical protein
MSTHRLVSRLWLVAGMLWLVWGAFGSATVFLCGLCFCIWSFVFAMLLERDANRLKRDAEEEKIKKLRRA